MCNLFQKHVRKCHCLRKCSRGWKYGSADFDKTCSRSWLFQKPSWFRSLTFSSKVTGGSHLGPPDHEKSCLWKGKFGPPWKQTNKALSVIHCMVCFCIAKGLSVHACRFGVEGSGRLGPGTSFGQIFKRKLPSKLSNFGKSYFFTALLAKIDNHIRSYLNPSIMKVNWKKIGPWNVWMLSRPILEHTITKFAFSEKQHFDTHTGLISIWSIQPFNSI